MRVIEVGHIYVDELIAGNIDLAGIARSIEIARQEMTPKDITVVLIDDKAHALSLMDKIRHRQQVDRIYTNLGLKPDGIYFEKSFSDSARQMLGALPHQLLREEGFRKERKTVVYLTSESRKIPLVSRSDVGEKFTCPMLSCAWLLYKEQFMLDTNGRGEILTILDEKYRHIEEAVLHIHDMIDEAGSVVRQYRWY